MNETALRRNVDIAGWLRQGWRMFWQAPAVFALSTALAAILILIFSGIPLLFIIVARPMLLGIYLVILDQHDRKPFSLSRLFGGFAWLFPCVVADILINVFSAVGFALLVIPGLIISSWYIFTWLFMVDKGLGFWGAMEASRHLAQNDVMGFLLFYVALITVNLLGAMFLGVGLLVSIPVSAISIFIAYKELAGLDKLETAQSAA
jgi:uncharacterized membrane protein